MAELQLAPGAAGQADGGLAAEQAAALFGVAGLVVEAGLESEHGLQAVTEVFGAFQAPPRAAADAAGRADMALLEAVGSLDLFIADARVDQAIQRDAGGGGLRRARESAGQGDGKQGFLHCDAPKFLQKVRHTSGTVRAGTWTRRSLGALYVPECYAVRELTFPCTEAMRAWCCHIALLSRARRACA
ncbi:Uncharacterised protein [Bordetella pertussis]|nr:Uncharacterised protein [Bordetella pertussis]